MMLWLTTERRLPILWRARRIFLEVFGWLSVQQALPSPDLLSSRDPLITARLPERSMFTGPSPYVHGG
jgi:hypothetical protein